MAVLWPVAAVPSSFTPLMHVLVVAGESPSEHLLWGTDALAGSRMPYFSQSAVPFRIKEIIAPITLSAEFFSQANQVPHTTNSTRIQAAI